MNFSTIPTPATELDRFLAGMVADAADELEAENLTEFDRFLAGLVADAAAELAVEDALEAAEAARAVAPVYHVNLAVHGPVDSVLAQAVARIMTELSYPETERLAALSPALAEAESSGRIGGQFRKSGGLVRLGKPITNETARFSQKPSEPRKLKCLKPKWDIGSDGHGCGYKIWHKCNNCASCDANALNRKAWRWDVGRGPFQGSIMVVGAANADEARKWTGQLAKAVKLPNRASLVTDAGEIWIVSADPLEYDTIERIRRFAAAEHGNCKRPAMQCTIKSENIKGSDLVAFVRRNTKPRTAQGEQRHVSFRLHGAAFAEDPVEDDFSLGDGTPIPADQPMPTEVVLSTQVRKSRSWRKVKNPQKRERRRIAARAEQAQRWCEGKNILTYTGPTKMLRQYAEFKAGKRDYEPAWGYVAELLGDDVPATRGQ